MKKISAIFFSVFMVIMILASCTQPITQKANTSDVVSAQASRAAVGRPFPQNIDYPGCIKPQEEVNQDIMNKQVKELYVDWVKKYVKDAPKTPGGYYIWMNVDPTGGNGITSSEAHGYGMLTFAMMAGADLTGIEGAIGIKDAKEYYDGMFKMFKAHPSKINPYLMSWVIGATEDPTDDSDSATDGDMDIAYSLVMAHEQWGSNGTINYIEEAQKLIMYGIKPSEMCDLNKRVMLGDWSDWTSYLIEYGTRPSDWMVGHFRVFEKVTNDGFWNDAINEIYRLTDLIQTKYSPNTGLIPDFVVGNDNPRPAFEGWFPSDTGWLEGPHDGDYGYNACRFPWRVSLDYAHYGEKRAKDALDKISDWLIEAHTEMTGDPAKLQYVPGSIVCGYYLDGTRITWPGDPNDPTKPTQWHGMSFTAPFTLACMVGTEAKHQDAVNKGWWEMVTTPEGYYEDSINLLCALALTGNWWKPAENVTIPPAPTKIPRLIGLYPDDYKDRVEPSHLPPLGMDPKNVPLLVSLGWDDNEYESGMNWAINLLSGKKNPAGNGVAGTFDGTDIGNSFFMCSWYDDPWWKVTDEWQKAETNGNEIGNHSYSHNADNINVNTSAATWREEISRADREIGQAGISQNLIGWRTPFLSYNAELFPVLKDQGLWYDCSIEEGFKWGQDGTNCYWPYTLNTGSPGHNVMYEWGTKPFPVVNEGEVVEFNDSTGKFEIKNAGTIGGLWELPVYALTVPPVDISPEYGVNYDMRQKFHELYDWFSIEEGKVTGFDFNLWFLFNMEAPEALATLKYSLDLRLLGNRAPLLIGSHTGEYTDEWQKIANDELTENNLPLLRTTPDQRKKVIEDFITYARTKQEVRIVSYKDVLEYCRKPVGLDGNTPTPTPVITPTPTPTATPPQDFINIAKGKKIVASSQYQTSFSAPNANDGSTSTLWASALEETQSWIYVDLGSIKQVEGLRVKWYDKYYATKYQIYYSNDGAKWTKAADMSKTNGNMDELIASGPVGIRYLGLYFTNKNDAAYAVTEFEILSRQP